MKFFLSLFSFILLFSCSDKENKTIINGNIPNLPDGTLYLYNVISDNRIDSVQTKNGIFKFTHTWKNNETTYLGIDHIDKKGVLRAFNFPTNAHYRGSAWNSQYFINDPNITINGKLTDFSTKDLNLTPKFKLVTAPKIISGKQTEAFYNIDADLFDDVSDKKIGIIKNKISTYPYSYHLLNKLESNKNNYSASQLKSFLDLFKGEITQSDTFKKLYNYNQKRFNEKNIALPLLENNKGVRKEIIDKKYKKHLIIFWASWCAPCRQEIPLLKKIYALYNKEIEFISISTDTDNSAWQKALKKENMDWKQLVVNNNVSDLEALQIHFKLNQSIPYTILVDNNIKILASSTGLSNEEELKKMINK